MVWSKTAWPPASKTTRPPPVRTQAQARGAHLDGAFSLHAPLAALEGLAVLDGLAVGRDHHGAHRRLSMAFEARVADQELHARERPVLRAEEERVVLRVERL